MSGILNNKSRILDTFITQEGRRQMAAGDLRIEFVTFTDDATYYKADIASGSTDATQRIYLECCNLPQDQITFEANDAGRLNPFKNLSGINVRDGRIVSSSLNTVSGSTLSGSNISYTQLTGSAFSSQSTELLNSTLQNFKQLRILGTAGRLLDSDSFELSQNNIEFAITEERPIPSNVRDYNHLTRMEGLFSDPRLSKVTNFKFLPPINKNKDKLVDTTDPVVIPDELKIGDFRPWGLVDPLEIDEIVRELSYYEQIGYCKELNFDPTSRNNSLIGQFFEVGNNALTKLDVIDYGSHAWQDEFDRLQWWQVFFVGKIITDDNGDDTFIHIFTLVFK